MKQCQDIVNVVKATANFSLHLKQAIYILLKKVIEFNKIIHRDHRVYIPMSCEVAQSFEKDLWTKIKKKRVCR